MAAERDEEGGGAGGMAARQKGTGGGVPVGEAGKGDGRRHQRQRRSEPPGWSLTRREGAAPLIPDGRGSRLFEFLDWSAPVTAAVAGMLCHEPYVGAFQNQYTLASARAVCRLHQHHPKL